VINSRLGWLDQPGRVAFWQLTTRAIAVNRVPISPSAEFRLPSRTRRQIKAS